MSSEPSKSEDEPKGSSGTTESTTEADKCLPNSSYHGNFSRGSRFGYEHDMHICSMASRFNEEYRQRREHEREQEEIRKGVSCDGIRIDKCHFSPRENAMQHHTDMFKLVQTEPCRPVLRRGQSFLMSLWFKERNYEPSRDRIWLIFNFGPNPSVPKGTKVVLPLGVAQEITDEETDKLTKWDAKIQNQEEKSMQIKVFIPVGVPVGVWQCWVETSVHPPPSTFSATTFQREADVSPGFASENISYTKYVCSSSQMYYNKERKGEIFKCNEDIYILFNPWCKEDPVYMENDNWRKEYVLNDVGKIWVGTYRRSKGRPWLFGQFDDVVLPAVMYLLEEARMGAAERTNPVRVVRAISEMVNCKDYNNGFMDKRWREQRENAVMYGRWDGHYDDGVSPYSWTGSSRILEQYLRTRKPVKYGQCWVFSALTTTICRAIGIPCRSVTNYVSAHDTNNSLTVDKYFSCEGDEIEGGPDGDSWDSVWNFHVWNDAWMARPDLPARYNGWQAVDSTFQEECDGRYKCGPTPHEAIKKGEMGLMYDTPFIFSEVNAEICHWMEDQSSHWGFVKMTPGNYHVGRQILTKAVCRYSEDGNDDKECILHQYKNKEGNVNEYEKVLNILRGTINGSKRQPGHKTKTPEDVSFELVEVERIQLGQPFNVSLSMKNNSEQTRSVQVMLSCHSTYYTGVKNRRVKQQKDTVNLKPNHREEIVLKVLPEEYVEKLVDYSMMKIFAIAKVVETRQTYAEEEDFCFEKPKLSVQALQQNHELQLAFTFANPLNIVLTNCKFSFEGSGFQRSKIVSFRDIRAGEMVTHTERIVPRFHGETRVVVSFTSHQLSEVTASKSITIKQ